MNSFLERVMQARNEEQMAEAWKPLPVSQCIKCGGNLKPGRKGRCFNCRKHDHWRKYKREVRANPQSAP